MNLNKVFLLGRAASNVELKTTQTSQSVCTFNLATNRTWKDKAGNKQEDTQFHRIVLWGRLAEIAHQFLVKGALVLIEGRLQTRNWEDKTGAKRYVTEVLGESLQLGPKPAGSNQQGQEFGEPEAFEEPDKPVSAPKKQTKQEKLKSSDEIDIGDIPF
jgi:single-strand DNA-binding protein